MPHSVYLFSTTLLAAVAAIQLSEAQPYMDEEHSSAQSREIISLADAEARTPILTISGITAARPTQPQRWVF